MRMGWNAVVFAAVLECLFGCTNEQESDDRGSVSRTLSLLDEGAAVYDDGDGVVQAPEEAVHAAYGKTSEISVQVLQRASQGRLDDGTPKDVQDILDKAKGMSPKSKVRVFITLDDVPFDWKRISAAADAQEHRSLLEERRGQAEAVATPMLQKLAGLGAENAQSFWVSPGIEVTLPAGSIQAIAQWPEVRRISDAERREAQRTEYTDAYSGLESRAGMRTSQFVSAGLTGAAGGRAGGALRVGLLESFYGDGAWDYLDWYHRGFIYCDASGCWYRTNIYYCENGACAYQTSPANNSAGAPTHANLVLQVMGGSIESGSDGSVTTTTGRVRRSGMAPRSSLYHYMLKDGYCSAKLAAIQQAITDQLDVLDFSSSFSECGCDWSCDVCGMNAAISNLRASGTLWTTVMGNDGNNGGLCNIDYPSQRRDGLTVAALDSIPQSASYDSLPMRTASSRGGMLIGVYGFPAGNALSVADLSAPGCWTYQYYYPPTNGYASVTPPSGNYGCGTSFAAPAVGGAAALLRQQFKSMGGAWATNDAGVLLVNMLLMGDGYSYDTGGFSAVGFNSRSGAGRVHMHYPSSANLTAPWGWGWHAPVLSSGQTATYNVGGSGAESSSVTQWKVAMTWFDTAYNMSSIISLTVRDTCHGNVVVAQDNSYDLRKRITLTQSQISGKCLAYTVSADFINPGETRSVYVADYYHSGNAADH